MSYTKIPNLYKDQTILMFKECWALEKICGTSAHISWSNGRLDFFTNEGQHETLGKLFDIEKLKKEFIEMDCTKVMIIGEFYGELQGMARTYGKDMKFIAFDVCIDSLWLCVPDAAAFVKEIGLEFVHYQKTMCDVSILNKLRDMPSVQAVRNGIKAQRNSEGIVLRPLIELKRNNGARICAKHKRDDFCERKTRQTIDSAQLKILEDANAIAEEWVTENRLNNVLSHMSEEHEVSDIPDVVKRMIADVQTEAKDEIVESKAARKAIGKRTVALFKKRITTIETDDATERFVRGVLSFQDKKAKWDFDNVNLKDYQPVRPKHTTIDPVPTGDE